MGSSMQYRSVSSARSAESFLDIRFATSKLSTSGARKPGALSANDRSRLSARSDVSLPKRPSDSSRTPSPRSSSPSARMSAACILKLRNLEISSPDDSRRATPLSQSRRISRTGSSTRGRRLASLPLLISHATRGYATSGSIAPSRENRSFRVRMASAGRSGSARNAVVRSEKAREAQPAVRIASQGASFQRGPYSVAIALNSDRNWRH